MPYLEYCVDNPTTSQSSDFDYEIMQNFGMMDLVEQIVDELYVTCKTNLDVHYHRDQPTH